MDDYRFAIDTAFRALSRRVVADPRNPHLIPALIDFFERAELPKQAELLRESGDVFVWLAKLMEDVHDG